MSFDLQKAGFGVESRKFEKVKKIALCDIEDNEKNFYSMDGIEELAESIKMVGLLEPVRVVQVMPEPDECYKLISGHRRLAAYEYLVDIEGTDGPRWLEIPALVMEDLDDLKETFALITANATARELTYAEKCKQEQLLRETLLGMQEAGQQIPKNLSQYIADQIGVSRNEVSRMHSVNEKLVPEAREKLDKGEMTAQQAYELSRKPEAEQKAAVSNLDAGAAETQRDAIGELSATIRAQNILKFARHHLRFWARDAVDGLTRKDAAKGLEVRKRYSASGGPGKCDGYYTACGGNKLELDSFGITTTWTEVWDALAIAALKRCAENESPSSPHPPASRDAEAIETASSVSDSLQDKELWHREDPTEEGTYAVLYRAPGTPGLEVKATTMTWRGEWQQFGMPVGDVYTVLRWTELPSRRELEEEDAEW